MKWAALGMAVAAVAVIAVVAAGCASTAPDRFYRLANHQQPPTQVRSAPAWAAAMPVVAIAAVSVPDLVDRPQMVTLGSGSRVQVSEQHRWAEPLKLAIGRLVAERIAAGLGSALVSAYPADTGIEADYRVSLSVQRFDSELGVAANDTVLWTVRRMTDGQLRSGRTAFSATPADASFDAMVNAHVDALGRIADEIARVIAEMK